MESSLVPPTPGNLIYPDKSADFPEARVRGYEMKTLQKHLSNPTRARGVACPQRVGCCLAIHLFLGMVQLLPSNAAAQSATTGAVSGTVTDPSGAIVPLAAVELVSNDTNAAQIAEHQRFRPVPV